MDTRNMTLSELAAKDGAEYRFNHPDSTLKDAREIAEWFWPHNDTLEQAFMEGWRREWRKTALP